MNYTVICDKGMILWDPVNNLPRDPAALTTLAKELEKYSMAEPDAFDEETLKASQAGYQR